MKKLLLFALIASLLAGCASEDMPPLYPKRSASESVNSVCATDTSATTDGNSSDAGDKSAASNIKSHYCNHPTKKGTPCKHLVSGATGYCWQHR